MLSPQALYPSVLAWLQALEVPRHRTARAALAHQVTAVLIGQDLRKAARMRALLSPQPVPARRRYRRAAGCLDRPELRSAALTGALVRATLALVEPDPAGSPTAGLTHLALDSVRCGPWEVFTLGVVWQGRVVPVGWEVLPYPWPAGQVRPAVCRLIRRVAAAWPADRPAQFTADRAFPSYDLFRELRAAGWGWTVRLQARHWVTVDEAVQQVRQVLPRGRLAGWTALPGSYGQGARAVAGTVVLGRGLVVLPAHQRTVGSLRHRQAQAARRDRHRASKHPDQDPAHLAATDQWVVLHHRTAPGWTPPTPAVERLAPACYRRRWATEGSYRDAQGGWDGQAGWQLETAVARLSDAAAVDSLAGLWALATLLQTWLGDQIGRPDAPPEVRAVARQWATTDRLSVWARGHFALTEPTDWLVPWITATCARGADRIRAAPVAPRSPTALPPPRPLRRVA